MPTPSKEDYIEAIWNIIQDTGYARTVHVAERLGISSSSVSRMIRRLDEDGLLVYQRYRGMVLTDEGDGLGQKLSVRRQILNGFFHHLGLNTQAEIDDAVEAIGHYMNATVLRHFEALVNYIEYHSEWWDEFKATGDDGRSL